MTRVLTACAFAALALLPTIAAADEYPHHPVNFSLFYPVATSRNPDLSTNFRLNLTYSRIGAMRGIDINGLVSVIARDMRGLQLTGAYSHIGGDMRGIAATGGINYVRGRARGVQFAGLVNYNRDRVSGLQWALLFNFAERDVSGVQLSSWFNLTNGDGRFLQIGTIGNITAGAYRGLQLTTGINYVAEDMRGAQAGLTNFATEQRGVQVGVLNAARTADGPQIGVLNISREMKSVPVGLATFADNSNTDWISYGSTLAAFSTGIRTSVNGFYSMLALGVGDLKDERNDSAMLSWHYGYAWEFGGRWSIGPDVGWVHIMPQPSDTKNGKYHPAVQVRATAQVRFSGKFAVFFGGGISTVFDEYRRSPDSETDPLGFVGVSVF